MAWDIISNAAAPLVSLGAGSESKMTWAHGFIHIWETKTLKLVRTGQAQAAAPASHSESDLKVWEDRHDFHWCHSGLAVMLGDLTEQKGWERGRPRATLLPLFYSPNYRFLGIFKSLFNGCDLAVPVLASPSFISSLTAPAFYYTLPRAPPLSMVLGPFPLTWFIWSLYIIYSHLKMKNQN